jgi:hypothetical protein
MQVESSTYAHFLSGKWQFSAKALQPPITFFTVFPEQRKSASGNICHGSETLINAKLLLL